MADPEQQGEWWERLRTGVCRECGQTFTTRASQRRYCTNVCRDAARVDRYKAQRDARRADPQAQRDHAARAKLYKSHASVEARWHARRFAVAFARSRRPWIARDAGGRRVRAGDTVSSFVVTRDLAASWIWKDVPAARMCARGLNSLRYRLRPDRPGQDLKGATLARPKHGAGAAHD